jgi:hypothetical protein
MGFKGFLTTAAVVWNFGISAVFAAVPTTEVVNLPTEAAYGGGDKVGSQLVAATYNAGGGPGIWIVADGGYRLYHNGALLAEDNQAGRVRFIPMTFLPGENAISVVGVNVSGAPGVMVQIDDLDKSYYSGSEWKSKPTVSNNAWKNKGRDLSQWGGATTLSYASSKMPSGGALNGFAANTQAKWIWTAAETDPTAVLLFTFYVKAEGFGAATTGGDAGKIVFASDSASIRKYLQSNDAVTILVPEGTYDFRQFRDAATEANAAGRTWCTRQCSSGDVNKNNTFYRINFAANTCSGMNDGDLSIVPVGAVKSWSNWITIRGNKSLVGMGRGANLRGASLNNRKNENAGNNIFRNLGIYDINPHLIEAGDGLEVSGNIGDEVEKIWFDHISYKWISDGMDLEHVKGLTVSYVDYDGANDQNCYYYDPYMHLVENAQATMHHMYWHNSFGRVPKVYSKDGGKVAPTVHVYNSYVEYNHWHIIDVTGTSSLPAQLLYENNYIGTANIQIAGKNAYGKVNMKNITVKTAKNSKPYDNNGTSQATPFTDNVFTPGYSYSLMNVNDIPTEVPKLSGVGGRYGKMPEYNQAFGQSNKAATVSLTAPAANAKFDSGDNITLSATAKDNDGTVKNVAFYVGNTLVGSATAAPYQVTVSGVEPGLHSAVAVVTDNSGLTQMSEFIAFTIEGATSPEVVKCGAGPSKQDDLTLGDAIVDFCYTWSGAETVVATGFPKGIVTDIDNANRKISISGTPSEAGVFEFTVSASANGETFTKTGRMTITDPNAPSSGESSGASFTTGESTQSVAFSARNATAGKTAYYRIFDMQGRPLFAGHQKPAKMPAARVIVVEYTTAGTLKRRYVQ